MNIGRNTKDTTEQAVVTNPTYLPLFSIIQFHSQVTSVSSVSLFYFAGIVCAFYTIFPLTRFFFFINTNGSLHCLLPYLPLNNTSCISLPTSIYRPVAFFLIALYYSTQNISIKSLFNQPILVGIQVVSKLLPL